MRYLNNLDKFTTKIYITTRRVQNRKHKKKRINKKWGKIYGYTDYEVQEKGKFIFLDDCVYITYSDFELLSQSRLFGKVITIPQYSKWWNASFKGKDK